MQCPVLAINGIFKICTPLDAKGHGKVLFTFSTLLLYCAIICTLYDIFVLERSYHLISNWSRQKPDQRSYQRLDSSVFHVYDHFSPQTDVYLIIFSSFTLYCSTMSFGEGIFLDLRFWTTLNLHNSKVRFQDLLLRLAIRSDSSYILCHAPT